MKCHLTFIKTDILKYMTVVILLMTQLSLAKETITANKRKSRAGSQVQMAERHVLPTHLQRLQRLNTLLLDRCPLSLDTILHSSQKGVDVIGSHLEYRVIKNIQVKFLFRTQLHLYNPFMVNIYIESTKVNKIEGRKETSTLLQEQLHKRISRHLRLGTAQSLVNQFTAPFLGLIFMKQEAKPS